MLTYQEFRDKANAGLRKLNEAELDGSNLHYWYMKYTNGKVRFRTDIDYAA